MIFFFIQLVNQYVLLYVLYKYNNNTYIPS